MVKWSDLSSFCPYIVFDHLRCAAICNSVQPRRPGSGCQGSNPKIKSTGQMLTGLQMLTQVRDTVVLPRKADGDSYARLVTLDILKVLEFNTQTLKSFGRVMLTQILHSSSSKKPQG